MIVTITVPFEHWLPLRHAQMLSARYKKPVEVTYMCESCQKGHVGILLSMHPEILKIQLWTGH